MNRINYVCGFLFDEKGELVLLIKKNRPAWMAGKWNGIGGKIEVGESAIGAMHREFEEETAITGLDWTCFASLDGRDFKVEFFSAKSQIIAYARKMTDEEIAAFYVRNLGYSPSTLVSNLPVLISLALDESGIHKPVRFRDTTFYPPRPAAVERRAECDYCGSQRDDACFHPATPAPCWTPEQRERLRKATTLAAPQAEWDPQP